MEELAYVTTCNGQELPTAGWLMAKQLSDGKEMFVTSGNTDGELFGRVDGEYTKFDSGTFELFRK